MKHTDRPAPTPLPLMRAQLAAFRDGLRGEELAEVTRHLMTPEAFADWQQGIEDGRNPNA